MFVQTGDKLHIPINPKGLGVEIYDAFHRHKCNKKIALIDAQTKYTITFAELLDATVKLATALENENLNGNDYVAIFSENHVNFFIPIIAAFYLGVPVSPINFNYMGDELVHVLGLAKAKIVFCSSTVVDKLVKVLPRCNWIKTIILIDSLECTSDVIGVTTLNDYMKSNYRPIAFIPRSVDCASHTLGILCSSGTTGFPKGVELTHQNILVRIIQMMDPKYNEIYPDDTKLALLPYFHGYGFVATLGFLVIGDKVLVMKRFQEELMLRYISEYKIKTLNVVPPIIVALAKSPHVEKYDLSSLQTIISGAAPLDAKIELVAKKRLNITNILQGYGLTEATQATLFQPYPIKSGKSGSTGVVLPGMSAAIMNFETGELLGSNQPGELCFKGLTVMKGYLNNPEATAESFKNGWLVTGDIAYYDNDGYFYVIDRRKELIKYKSFQVAPAELEAILLGHPKIKDAGVIGIPDNLAGELPMGFVVKQSVDLNEQEVIKYIEDRVSNAKRLRGGVRFIDSIPKNPSGKILRRQLREMAKIPIKSKF